MKLVYAFNKLIGLVSLRDCVLNLKTPKIYTQRYHLKATKTCLENKN